MKLSNKLCGTLLGVKLRLANVSKMHANNLANKQLALTLHAEESASLDSDSEKDSFLR